MKVAINGFIVARQYPWEDAPSFSHVNFDPRECGLDDYVVVCPHDFDADVPDDFDIRPYQIKELEKKKQELREKFAMAVKELDDRINSLLAINSAKVVSDGTEN